MSQACERRRQRIKYSIAFFSLKMLRLNNISKRQSMSKDEQSVPWVMTHMHAMRITHLSSELSNAITAFVSFTVVPNNGFLQRRNNFAGEFDYSPRFNSSQLILHVALMSSSMLSHTTY